MGVWVWSSALGVLVLPHGPCKYVGVLVGPSVCTNTGVWVCPPRLCTFTGTRCGVRALVWDGMTSESVGSSVGPAISAADGDMIEMLFGRVVGMLVGGVVRILVGGVVGMLVSRVARALLGDFVNVDSVVWV